ncbi:MAG: acyltransferase family protein, partial [Lachnospiraceae bacterium]|nr:acyltransferase family protein [Lachnospiraceae bacterium]
MKIEKNTEQIRKSGIELLKIIAILLIVINHVTQTLGSINQVIGYKDYVLSLENATKDIQVIILILLRQTGSLGNSIFFVCSAWFLVEKKGDSKEKAFSLLSTVWVISIIFMCIYMIICPSSLSIKEIMKGIFPTLFASNWYMTCYIIFLFIYPL